MSSAGKQSDIFTVALSERLRDLIEKHHTLYPRIPPKGEYFEALVERAFILCGTRDIRISRTSPNQPEHDLEVAGQRISIKTETGKKTNRTLISITKLCTTEKGTWTPTSLLRHVNQHLLRYDRMLMLRATWPNDQRWIHYQLLAIPVEALRLVRKAKLVKVGKRKVRQSLSAEIEEHGKPIFRVLFDGTDGKCVINKLLVSRCRMLSEWNQPIG